MRRAAGLDYDRSDGHRYARRLVAYNASLIAGFLLVRAELVPAPVLVLVVPVLFVRWLASLHELAHIVSPPELSWPTSLLPILSGPLSLGFREMRRDHLDHHGFALTARDPALFLIQGSKLRGLLVAVTAPEQIVVRWIAAHGCDARLARDLSVRGALFVCAAAWGGSAFAWYFACLRLAFGAAFFTFFYVLHRRGDATGMFETPIPRGLEAALLPLLGSEILLSIRYHDRHHAAPRVAAASLGAQPPETWLTARARSLNVGRCRDD